MTLVIKMTNSSKKRHHSNQTVQGRQTLLANERGQKALIVCQQMPRKKERLLQLVDRSVCQSKDSREQKGKLGDRFQCKAMHS